MKAFKTKTAVVILGALILVASASVALAKYKYNEGTSEKEYQTVKTEAPATSIELQAAPDQTTSSAKPDVAGWTYEQQGEVLKENQRIRQQMLQEADNR